MGKKILSFFLLSVFLSAGCVTEKQVGEKILVVVTIPPQAEFVEKIGGDLVEVEVMVPPGASPHTYDPLPSQLSDVGRARMYAKVGSGVDFELSWFSKLQEINKDMFVVDCSKGIELIGNDPHIWTSPKNAQIMVENIYEGLVEIDPVNQEYYQRNKENYLSVLDGLDADISDALAQKTNKINRKIIVYHPAWTYFCRDYGLEQIPIEEGGKEPTPRGLINLVNQAKADNITIIFASPQFNTDSAEAIAREINGVVVLIDPLKKEYVDNIQKVAGAFAEV